MSADEVFVNRDEWTEFTRANAREGKKRIVTVLPHDAKRYRVLLEPRVVPDEYRDEAGWHRVRGSVGQ